MDTPSIHGWQDPTDGIHDLVPFTFGNLGGENGPGGVSALGFLQGSFSPALGPCTVKAKL